MTEALNGGWGVRAEDLVIHDHHVEDDEHEGDHVHEHADEGYWDVENVELTTVGIDIGSSTSHLMFARVHLQRLAQALSSRFVVVRREVLWRSGVMLTPYLPDNTIDAGALESFIHAAYEQAGIARADVDTGAVILTGEALKRRNAKAIAELFAEEGGRFVCASAGHHLEATMAAHGSGAVALSRNGKVVLNVDIGGGTSKFALCRDGEILDTAAVAVGGRLVAHADRRVTRVEGPANVAASTIRSCIALGDEFGPDSEQRLVQSLVDVLLDMIAGGDGGDLGRNLMVTEPLASRATVTPDVVTFSGGVAEYFYGRERGDHGDLARGLADALHAAIASGRIDALIEEPPEGIRATVIGASQFSVQVSGNTVALSDESVLPLQNVPVLHPRPELGEEVEAGAVAAAVRKAADRYGSGDGQTPVAISLKWEGEPLYRRLRALADGLSDGMASWVQAGQPLIVLVDGDIGSSLGHVLRDEIGVPVPVVCLDGVALQELDYVDVGELIRPSSVVPLVIKSLLFTSDSTVETRELVAETVR
ncbi:MAG: ethanolamine ammonia-lyase reactivating factor EutA [Actinomycetota bacterium]|nr:ethanolamine ammonia-lyase reactivating factor EutA [Actinomycetota bacterium]